MLDIEKRIDANLIKALKAKESDIVYTLRLVKTALKNEQIAKKEELNESDILKVLKKEAKKRKEASIAFEKGNRPQLKEKEDTELKIILEYLPEEISDEELNKLVDEVLSNHQEASMQDFGTIMKEVMAKTDNQVDGSRVSGLVKGKLSS